MENKAVKKGTLPAPESAPQHLALVVERRVSLRQRLMSIARHVIMAVGHFRMARDMDWETWRRLEYRNEFPDYDRKRPIEYRQWL